MPTFSSNASGSYGAIPVGGAAVLIVRANANRGSVLIQNEHATNILYLGLDSAVTAANGIKVDPNESLRIEDYRGDVYGFASGAGTDVRFMEMG